MSGIHLDIPVLETERLVLRAPVTADFPAYRAYFASERSQYTGGPRGERETWAGFATLLGHWLIRGFGMWTICERGSETPAGHAGCWQPATWPEAEIGWIMYDGYEGRGYAFEAASAIRDHAFGPMGWTTAVSYIRPGNDRSVALAERLGAFADAAAPRPQHAPDCLVYRHPGPGAAA
ncbi:GNAT family N-acetyltransferase [Tropicimonas marinistellae]|uniref:GNAT family N-acetyltransferase n=1 Tax=Tropicimonas marinistellae TaxID=1739787 RepID=UPI0008356E99|nr:GNAT family N-acetyltransferase [Tropicimonas marinistellae]